MSTISMLRSADPYMMEAAQPIQAAQPTQASPQEGLVHLVNRLAIERIHTSEARVHQLMDRVSDLTEKRQVAVQLLEQVTRCTDGTGRLDVSKMDAQVVSRARAIFGDRLEQVSGVLSSERTTEFRSQVEGLERETGNLEAVDQMKLQSAIQAMQRDATFFSEFMRRIHEIIMTIVQNIGRG
jgi:hypothetical protein